MLVGGEVLDVLEGVVLRDFGGFATALGWSALFSLEEHHRLRVSRLTGGFLLVLVLVLMLVLSVAKGAQILRELEFLLRGMSQNRIGMRL